MNTFVAPDYSHCATLHIERSANAVGEPVQQRTRQELENYFQCILDTSDGTPFVPSSILRATLTGAIRGTLLSGNLERYVTNTVLILQNASARGELRENKQILFNMLSTDSFAFIASEDRDTHLRVHLKHVLVLLAEIAFADGSHDCIKSLVVFLLENVMPVSNGKNKYKDLLQRLNLLMVDESGETTDPDKFKMRKCIIGFLVGNGSMNSVVDCHHAKNALKYPWNPLANHWAQDDVVPRATLDEIVSALTLVPPGDGGNVHGKQRIHASGSDASDDDDDGNDDELAPLPNLGNSHKWYSGLFWRSSTVNADLAGEARSDLEKVLASMETTGSAYSNDVRGILAKLKKAISIDQVPSRATETPGSQSHPNTRANRYFGDATNGLTITYTGIKACLMKIFRNEHTSDEIRLEIAIILGFGSTAEFQSWLGQHPNFSAHPETDIERALSGTYWTIEDVEFIKYLGGGAFGSVYLSRLKKKPWIHFAVKLQCLDAFAFYDFFAAEVTQGSKLKHPNILRTLGLFHVPSVYKETRSEGRPCHKDLICMALMLEPCLGTLHDEMPSIHILKPDLRLLRACNIILDILSALVVLEESLVYHRDIKPNNILLGMDSLWKLSDFGLARMSDKDGTWSLMAGTPGYIPPEGPGPRHDIFSAGMVFLEMVTGSRSGNIVPREAIVRRFRVVGLESTVGKHQFNKAVDLCAGMLRRFSTERLTAKSALAKAKKLRGLLQPSL